MEHLEATVNKKGGLGRERDYPYQGKGPGDCNAFKGPEKQAKSWKWSGFTGEAGAEGIEFQLALGFAQYVAFACGSNFIAGHESADGWTDGGDGVWVYTGPASGGGHAVTAVGYGVTKKGIKYWRIQNSWGTKWAERGFGNYEKGKNLGGIDNFGMSPRSWVEGGKEPPCYDSSATFAMGGDGGGYKACWDLRWKMCTNDWKNMARAACRIMCEVGECKPGEKPAYSGKTWVPSGAQKTTPTSTTTKASGGGGGCPGGKKACYKACPKAKKVCKAEAKAKKWKKGSKGKKAKKKFIKKCTKEKKKESKTCKKQCKKDCKKMKGKKKMKGAGKSGRRRRAV
eukprot:gnl/TRDRNA2_/TRDRNA2_149638_c3_seq1.p1 gnl/TRDRNA2_/TRDRNA2_149638_c3~~gnl/TRDRNA2_/TRDRNA2_149638_c3_seq1.p1  ORF type:complete len:371 (-),score=70.75 gnl/TRDRNA2_/TRDRNA2_149638_c3_seq1:44-1063(-)